MADRTVPRADAGTGRAGSLTGQPGGCSRAERGPAPVTQRDPAPGLLRCEIAESALPTAWPDDQQA